MSDTLTPVAKDWNREPFDRMLNVAQENGYKKKDVAGELGIPAPTLSDWISGKHAPHKMFQNQFSRLEEKFKRRPKK